MNRVILASPIRTLRSENPYVKEKKVPGNNPTGTPPSQREGRGVPGSYPGQEVKEVKDKVQSILDSTESLSEAERKELLAKLSLKASSTDAADVRDIDMWVAAVYSGLVTANGGSGGGVPGPMVIKRILGVPSAWGPVKGFMESSKLLDLKVTERQAVYGMLADLVIKNATYISRERHVPMSPRLVGNCSANVAGLFDQMFPGYLRAGLAPIVARRLTQPI